MVSSNTVVSPILPTDSAVYQVLEALLSTRIIRRGKEEVAQVLIKWSSMPPELATWEDTKALRQQFPLAPTWGQAGAKEGRSVSNPADNALPARGQGAAGPTQE
jgi:hypothetical protein